MTIFNIIITALLGALFFIWLFGMIWIITPWRPFKWFYHDILEWHEPDLEKGIEIHGPNVCAKCKYCGKHIIQDSQGNWY